MKQQTPTCSVFKTLVFLRQRRKTKEQIITCGISKQLCVELQLSQLSLKKLLSLPTFIRTPLTGHLFFLDIWGGWAAMAQRCHPRQCTLSIYLWEGFWNGFLPGQTCEIPATARETILEHLHA